MVDSIWLTGKTHVHPLLSVLKRGVTGDIYYIFRSILSLGDVLS